jgi:hypothetical protein
MAESDESSDSILPEPLRTVTPPSRTHPNQDMDIIGWGIFLVLLVPLLPFIIIVWVISKIVEALTPT